MEEDIRTRVRERGREAFAAQSGSGEKEGQGKCAHCGAVVEPGYEICPVCGWKLVDYCTFCGAPMQPGDMDCPECGLPSDGLVCPDCNIRNFRPFCRQCGLPLSRASRKAVEKAKLDPKVQKAARLLKAVAELKTELEGGLPGGEQQEEAPPQEPTEGELRLQELMAKVGFTAASRPKATARRMGRSREEILAEYKKAVEEANKAMEEMLPPAGSTPQEQRNYFTARKVAVTELIEEKWYTVKVKSIMGWECNRCHVVHSDPSQCCVREFGGKWITRTEDKIVDKGTRGATEHTTVTENIVYKRQ